MILYDESGRILAVDKQSIKFFGYTDIESFKQEVNDIADFFIEKEGYIHKFEHFNWIDYLNYSEEDINKALMRKTDGKCVEVEISVDELFPLVDVDGSKSIYAIYLLSPVEKELKSEDVKENENIHKNDELPSEEQILVKDIDIDYEEIEEKLGLDKELYLELLRDFIEESKKDLETIKAHMENSNYDILTKIINKLTSVCTNLNLSDFNPILSGIRSDIDSKNFDDIIKFLNIFSSKLDKLSQNLKRIAQ